MVNTCLSWGNKRSGFVILGESPGPNELIYGRPFYPEGVTGKFVKYELAKHGINMDRDCFLINSICCDVNNLDQKRKEDFAFTCGDHVYENIFSKPRKVILAFGRPALRATTAKISYGLKQSRKQDYYYDDGTRIIYTYHPSFFLNYGNGSQDSKKIQRLCQYDIMKAVRYFRAHE